MTYRSAGLVAVALCLIALTGCATSSKPKLTTIDSAIPAGVRLDGLWRLRADGDKRDRDSTASVEDEIGLPPEGRNRARRKPGGAAVMVFLEFGETLKITQTDYGLFISFDRAIVEEYRFREHRTVNVGPIEAERVSGWEDGGYVIRTIDDKGALLTEKYSLENDGDTLVRSVRVDFRNEPGIVAERRFDRID